MDSTLCSDTFNRHVFCVRQENDHLGAMGDIWIDVTDVCRKAASELDNVQSMLHVDHFTLKETMSAVELMDKKMDQCMGLQGSIQTKDLLTPDIPQADIAWLLR